MCDLNVARDTTPQRNDKSRNAIKCFGVVATSVTSYLITSYLIVYDRLCLARRWTRFIRHVASAGGVLGYLIRLHLKLFALFQTIWKVQTFDVRVYACILIEEAIALLARNNGSAMISPPIMPWSPGGGDVPIV